MSLPRCPHGVYNSGKDGESTIYCSGCYPPEESAFKFPYKTQYSPFPYAEKCCPICSDHKKFKFTDEDTWHCNACGADAGDI